MSNKFLKFDYVNDFIKEQGYELLETNYINSKTKMNIKCFKCNNIFDMSWNKFKNGRRCRFCKIIKLKQLKRLDQNKIKECFEKENWKIIEINYENNTSPIKCICPNGHEQIKKYSDFQQGKRCQECFNKIRGNIRRIDYKDIKEYIESFNYKLISTNYNTSSEKIELKCDKGHLFKIRFSNFKRGVRCVYCYKLTQFGETNVRYQPDRTRRRRTLYLMFDHRKINILKDDPNYNNFILSKNNKLKNNYHIDHIFPRMAFIDNDLDKLYGQNLIKEICNSRDNLQIITQKENNSKSSKYNQSDFINWFTNKLILNLMNI